MIRAYLKYRGQRLKEQVCSHFREWWRAYVFIPSILALLILQILGFTILFPFKFQGDIYNFLAAIAEVGFAIFLWVVEVLLIFDYWDFVEKRKKVQEYYKEKREKQIISAKETKK